MIYRCFRQNFSVLRDSSDDMRRCGEAASSTVHIPFIDGVAERRNHQDRNLKVETIANNMYVLCCL